MLYEGLIRGRGATISTQVGACRGLRCNESGLSNFAQAYRLFRFGRLAKRIGISYAAGFAPVFPLASTASYAGV